MIDIPYELLRSILEKQKTNKFTFTDTFSEKKLAGDTKIINFKNQITQLLTPNVKSQNINFSEATIGLS